MFADAGAEVVKIESPQGDCLRSWSAGGPASGALFGYLAANKKSVVCDDHAEAAALLAGADVVFTDLTDGWTLDDITAHTSPSAVVVAVTPFGTTGPYVDEGVLANEFILQALCGSIAGRGWPGDEPVQAGGRLGEWLAGTFAAAVGAAAARHAARGGGGEIVDVSTYEAMVIAMGGLSAMSASVLGADSLIRQRSLELPSIVPTADGMVGFCTITAQQFQDFLVHDRSRRSGRRRRPGLVRRPSRAPRRVPRHGHPVDARPAPRRRSSTSRWHSEFRWLPSRLRPRCLKSITSWRAACSSNPSSGCCSRGCRIAATPSQPSRPGALRCWAPTTAACTGLSATGPARAVDPDALPLSDIRITDFTAFWAGPVATQFLGALGADVIKLEGVRRPDGMRFSAGRPPDWDQWWEWGPVFLCSNNNKRGVSVELSTEAGRSVALELIAASDLVLENFSPRVMENFDLDWDAVAAANPRAIMVRMPAFGLDGPWRDRVGFAQTMEQATGMAWTTGHSDGPPVIPRGICDPIAGLHAAFAAIAALVVRDRHGDRDACRIHHGGIGTERGRRDAGRILAQWNPAAPVGKSGHRRGSPGRLSLHRRRRVGRHRRASTTPRGSRWRTSSVNQSWDRPRPAGESEPTTSTN